MPSAAAWPVICPTCPAIRSGSYWVNQIAEGASAIRCAIAGSSGLPEFYDSQDAAAEYGFT